MAKTFSVSAEAFVDKLGFHVTFPPSRVIIKAISPGLWADALQLALGDEIMLINSKPVVDMTKDDFCAALMKRPLELELVRSDLEEDSSSLTTPPLRFRMTSADHLCSRSMELEWENGTGERQYWSSWDDALCSSYDADKIIPASSTDICVKFSVHLMEGGAEDIHKVDRDGGCSWVTKDDGSDALFPEVLWFRSGRCVDESAGIDATFQLAGPRKYCYVAQVWNAARISSEKEFWEQWPDEESRPRAQSHPVVLKEADKAAPPHYGRGTATHYQTTTIRLSKAVCALREILMDKIHMLNALDESITQQWYGVNSVNTVSAGLGVMSIPLLIAAPPVGIAVGVASGVVGIASTAGDNIVDLYTHSYLREQMSEAMLNAVAVTELERDWLQARDHFGDALRCCEQTPLPLQNQIYVTSGRTIQAGTTIAKTVSSVIDPLVPTTAKVLGVAGAVLSVGIAIHGWSTTKELQLLVHEKVHVLQSACERFGDWLFDMNMECTICLQDMRAGDIVHHCTQARPHCFHEMCVRNWNGSCPLCRGPMASTQSAFQNFCQNNQISIIQRHLEDSRT